jgi:aldehyde dehydrogenase
MTVYAAPGTPDAKFTFKPRYENWIGGEWVKPVRGQYFEDISPVNGKPFCEIARGTAEDIELALDAAHKAAPAWGKTSATDRAAVLNKIADVIEANLELLAVAETWDNGKPIREPLNADLPLAADHFRYFAAAIRAQEGSFAEMDGTMTAYHYHEPLGVVGQIIPWNFPILMATWKLAPALAAGNAIVLKPAEQTPASILVLIELIGDILPPGVVNIVNGFGVEAGKPLASSPRIRKIAFTGETTTGRLILQYASANIIPATLELGGKSPNIFFKDVADQKDAFYDKALEGFTFYAFNQGEICTCPSRALLEKPIYDSFLADALERTKKIVQGNPMDTDTQVGAQASNDQLEKIMSYIDIGKQEGAKLAIGGERVDLGGDLTEGYYVQPTIFEGNNKMRLFQEEIFGPVLAVTSFDGYDDAISIANDTLYGLGAGVWSRNGNVAYRAGRDIQAGRVWINQYHKSSGIGRENNRLALDHYQQTKNLLVSYDENALGFF